MTATSLELIGDISGISASEPISITSDTELHVIYEANKCYSAWVEHLVDERLIRKIPFVSTRISQAIQLPAGSAFRVVASIQPGGNLKLNLVY